MRRADRLFQIVQLLRRRRVTTAARLAEDLEVSERTIYRDISDLMASGIPIDGEAGVGYALPRGFDLPPLMFNRNEIEALVLGARIVKAWADPELAKAADAALLKVEAVLPDSLKSRIAEATLFAPQTRFGKHVVANLAPLRAAIHGNKKVHFGYTRRDGDTSERTIQPLGLFYWGSSWSLVGWCELRDAFRNFRLDRMLDLTLLETTFQEQPGRTLNDFLSLPRGPTPTT